MENDITAAPVENVSASSLHGTATNLAHDMSFWDLFRNADIVVQLVILGLILTSFWCWAIVFRKLSLYKTILFKTRRFETSFWSGTSLDQLYEKTKGKVNHPAAKVFVAAMDEIGKTKTTTTTEAKAGLLSRIEKVMHISRNKSLDELENQLSVLATAGAITPFVGLFGTVWGIMNSFTSIAAAKNISLAIVAPGIAEALFATAIGLGVAIPAVIFYNKFTKDVNAISNRLEDFSDEFLTLVSRQLDEGRM